MLEQFEQWFRSLEESQRLIILTAVAERLTQLIRYLLAKVHLPLGDTVVQKLAKMMLALANTAWLAYLTTGPSDTFWKQWLVLFATTTLAHEFIGKPIRAIRAAKQGEGEPDAQVNA